MFLGDEGKTVTVPLSRYDALIEHFAPKLRHYGWPDADRASALRFLGIGASRSNE